MHQIQGHRIYRASIVWPKRQPEPVRPGLGSNRDSATLPLYSTATLYSALPLYSILYSTLPLYSTHHSVPLRPIHLKYAGPAWCCYTTLRPPPPVLFGQTPKKSHKALKSPRARASNDCPWSSTWVLRKWSAGRKKDVYISKMPEFIDLMMESPIRWLHFLFLLPPIPSPMLQYTECCSGKSMYYIIKWSHRQQKTEKLLMLPTLRNILLNFWS